MKITPAEANDILSKRYPTPDELERFPFGNLLTKLWDRNDGDNADFREHGPKVLQMMNILLSNEPNELLHERNNDSDDYLLPDTKSEMERIFGHFDSNTRALFRVGALYHDIGKYIIKERHPTIGWYTLEYSDSEEKNDLRALLGNREDYFQLLMIMLRDHDEFGTLSTGEASYPILLRAANSLGNQPDVQKQILSALMWLNLADMAGTPKLLLVPGDVRKVIHDWKWMLNAIEVCANNKAIRLEDYVIREASREDLVEERISRLLQEACRGIRRRHDEFRVKNPPDKVHTMVRNALRTVYPTDIPRREFASQFTHICKLDYGKRFFASLVEYYEGPPEPDEKRRLRKWSKEFVTNEDLIYSTLAIMRRLSSTYTAMTRSDADHPGSLIGVEMKDLTPYNAEEKTAQIIELLHRSHYPGLSWMMSDCLAWYF